MTQVNIALRFTLGSPYEVSHTEVVGEYVLHGDKCVTGRDVKSILENRLGRCMVAPESQQKLVLQLLYGAAIPDFKPELGSPKPEICYAQGSDEVWDLLCFLPETVLKGSISLETSGVAEAKMFVAAISQAVGDFANESSLFHYRDFPGYCTSVGAEFRVDGGIVLKLETFQFPPEELTDDEKEITEWLKFSRVLEK